MWDELVGVSLHLYGRARWGELVWGESTCTHHFSCVFRLPHVSVINLGDGDYPSKHNTLNQCWLDVGPAL